MFRYRCLSLFSCVLLACGLASCQQNTDGPTRFEVSGEIKVDGRPARAGEIMFEPDTSKGNSGPAGIAEIKDGKYTTLPELGTVGGPHIVIISANTGEMLKENGETPRGWSLLEGHRISLDLPHDNHIENFDISSAEDKAK